jgi:hypothetical protein
MYMYVSYWEELITKKKVWGCNLVTVFNLKNIPAGKMVTLFNIYIIITKEDTQ